MGEAWDVLRFVVYLGIVGFCNGLPVDFVANNQGSTPESIAVLVAVLASACIVVAFIGCLCCQKRNGFKVFHNNSASASVICETGLSNDPGHVNPIASSEFTIFTPLSPSHHNNNVFRSSQPLNRCTQNDGTTSSNKNANLQIEDLNLSRWFDGSQNNFSRSKLKYIRELGTGWFGRVVEGEAYGIKNEQGWTPVAVRILEASATAHEQSLFLHEAVMYKLDQVHPYLLRLLGYSLEAAPLLLIQEYCPRGDLKKFLRETASSPCSPILSDLLLKFCCQLASAVQFLHDNNIPHMDLAARNCQISSEMVLKLGDYSLAVSRYPEDYYQGVPAVPVRWCAPETLNHTTTTLQPKPMTCEGNIWSLGVTMWEICEFGVQPYNWLTDDEVISQVLGPPHVRLSQPSLSTFYIPHLYHLMQLCWNNVEKRPVIQQIFGMLVHLMQVNQNNTSKSPSKCQQFTSEDFDSRWRNLKPNKFIKTDLHNTPEGDGLFYEKVTDVSSTSSIGDLVREKSASLTNLHGSFDNLLNNVDDTNVVNTESQLDSWLQNVASHTDDMQYVEGLSQAIRALDSALASEQTSSSASSYPSPGPEQWRLEPLNNPASETLPKVEFQLGPKGTASDAGVLHSVLLPSMESSSETEDETWRKRIERGAYSEKVRMKSKSVTDLMVLTHIECSDTDSETPLQSLEYRQAQYRNVRLGPRQGADVATAGSMFGSEGNLLTVQDTFQQELRKLQEERRDSLLFVPARSSSVSDIFAQVLSSDRTRVDLGPVCDANVTVSLETQHSQPEHANDRHIECSTKHASQTAAEKVKQTEQVEQVEQVVLAVQVADASASTGPEPTSAHGTLDETFVRDKKTTATTAVSDSEASQCEDMLEDVSVSVSVSSVVRSDSIQCRKCSDDSNTKTDSGVVLKSEPSSEDSDFNINSISLLSCEFSTRDQVPAQLLDRLIVTDEPLQTAEYLTLVNLQTKESQPVDSTTQSKLSVGEFDDVTLVTSLCYEGHYRGLVDATRTFLDTERGHLTDAGNAEAQPVTQDGSPHITNVGFSELKTLSGASGSQKQSVNQVYNVFNVTIDHTAPIDLFSVSQEPVGYSRVDKANSSLVEISCDNPNKFSHNMADKVEESALTFGNGVNSLPRNGFLLKHLPKEGEALVNGIVSTINDAETDKLVMKNPLKLSEIILESLVDVHNGTSVQYTTHISKSLPEPAFPEPPQIHNECLPNCGTELTETAVFKQIHNELEMSSDLATHETKPISSDGEHVVHINSPLKLSEMILQRMPNLNYVTLDQGAVPLSNNVTHCNVRLQSPPKLSEIILNSMPSVRIAETKDTSQDVLASQTVQVCNNALNESIHGETSNNDSQPKLSETEQTFEKIEIDALVTSTPCVKKLEWNGNSDKEQHILSFVSEGDEHDAYPTVILGPCEDHMLGLYSGLKTTFESYSDPNEEELLQFSSNFMPLSNEYIHINDDDDVQKPYRNIGSFIKPSEVDYSLETWDRFLGKSFDEQNDDGSLVFGEVNNILKESKVFDDYQIENINGISDKTFDVKVQSEPTDDKSGQDDEIEQNKLSLANTFVKDTEDLGNASNWEPGEGWFLHPQTPPEELTGQLDMNVDSADSLDSSDFTLDEECVNALRTELAAKLPHAQRRTTEEEQEPFDWDSEERSEIVVKYNVYTTPLSPIPEESFCEETGFEQTRNRETDSDSDWSEPCLDRASQIEDILVVDTENNTALILGSPSLQEPRHTPSQDSCCSNDTLFNLDDLNFGPVDNEHAANQADSPLHETSTATIKPEVNKQEVKEEQEQQEETKGNIAVTTEVNVSIEDHSTMENLDSSIVDSGNAPIAIEGNRLELKLEPSMAGVAPLPSPEDIPWRQLPASLLTYSQVAQDQFDIDPDHAEGKETNPELEIETIADELEDASCLNNDLYSNLTDIRFSGPGDMQLMSTSFSESNDYAGERDWDSGSDTRSSSSGEFIWKEGEHEESLRALHAASHDVGVIEDINPLDIIEEENSESSNESDDGEDIEESEFVPSAWDSQATPTKSALRSPEKSNKYKNTQKVVWFKKQKYHCVYEYPREPESPITHTAADLWRPFSHLPGYTDWDVEPSCVPTEGAVDKDDYGRYLSYDYYPLPDSGLLDQLHRNPDFSAGAANPEDDFYISSSAKPFQSLGQVSQFFPGQDSLRSDRLWKDYQPAMCSRDCTDNVTPDSGVEDVTPASGNEYPLEQCEQPRSMVGQRVQTLKSLAAMATNRLKSDDTKSQDSLGGLRHTRNKLKLDLPPSPSSFTSNKTFSIELADDPVVNREVPTFTTFGKSRFLVQHVPTPTEDEAPSGKPQNKNVSFEALPHKPLGEVGLRLALCAEPEAEADADSETKHKAVEIVRGEASLLDSADEDSGIESSANATLERQVLN